jgi:hypothetical protein
MSRSPFARCLELGEGCSVGVAPLFCEGDMVMW